MSTPGSQIRLALRRQRGITLIELLVAVLIGLLLIFAAVVSLGQVETVNARTAARFMASTLRFGYDRARSTGRDHRFLFDLDAEGGTTVEFQVASQGHKLLPRDLDEAWKEQNALAEGEEDKQREEALEKTTIGGLSKDLLALKRPTGPQWQKVALHTTRAQERLKKSAKQVKGIYLPRLEQEVTEGKVALYAWGGGRIERAAVYLSDGKGRGYTLVTYPMTGRVKIYQGRKELPSDLINADDLGNRREDR